MSESPNMASDPNFFIHRYLRWATLEKKLDPKETQKIADRLKESIGLNINGELAATSSLKTFDKNRITKSTELKELKVNGKPIGEVIEKGGQTTAPIQTAIDSALEPTPEYTQSSKEFNKILTSINERAKKNVVNLDPSLVANLLNDEKAKMHKAMEKQFKAENDKLAALANKPEGDPFRDAFVNQMLGGKQADFKGAMEKLQKEVKAKQQAELKAFDKKLQDQVSTLYRQADAERTRIAYITSLYRKDPNFRAFLKKKVGEENIKAANRGENSGILLNIELKEIADAGLLSALSGRKIEYNKETNSYEYKFPSKWDILFNLSPENYGQDDMRSIAEAVKASGHDSIVLTVEHPNSKNAEEMARMAYEAARKTGFPPEKIQIKVVSGLDKQTGKKQTRTMKPEALFDAHPKWKDRIERDARQLELDRMQPQAAKREVTAQMRQKVSSLRESLMEQRPAPPAHGLVH